MNAITLRTAFEKEHFDPASVKVEPHSVDIERLLGFDLTPENIVPLSGAPTDSVVEVYFKDRWSDEERDGEDLPPGVYFVIRNPRYIASQNEVGMFVDGIRGYVSIYIKLVDFKAGHPKGIAARMLAVMVREALKVPGIRRIRLLAAGGRNWEDRSTSTDRWGGYIAWPRYGFDMPLLQGTVAVHPQFPYWPRNLAACRKVSDVLRLQGGLDFWKVVGDGHYMDFDLSSPSSASIAALDSFLVGAGR